MKKKSRKNPTGQTPAPRGVTVPPAHKKIGKLKGAAKKLTRNYS